MFEGLVRQLLLGYLGRYVKDIQNEQLKITLWNEEVLLENVELILEAFDYLQLPFALNQGRVGRLSIRIPWKKLGWDPVIISLEDVFVCASQRDDQEWSLDAVEKREFAGKKAKLAAAELAKLSRRVCDNQVGQSFMSFMTAKILDSIQVSIRNFHVLYCDRWSDSEHITLGLKFSSLMIMQNPIWSSSGRMRGGQVNKIVEIIGLEIYCSTFQGSMDLMTLDNSGNSKLWGNEGSEGKCCDSLLAPCNVSVSLLVNRSGKLENNAPQYSITAELTSLVISLTEIQLQQILILWDYLGTCQLREKYGRYRPWHCPLSRKLKGWQILWWHYAQESVLSDIRKKLKKTSWRYLGQRLSYRRKYVNLYRTKLDFLRQEQSIDEGIIRELEQMEKESDIDDILSYRSAAERELQEFLSKSLTSNMGMNGSSTSVEKSRNDEHSTGKSRGWLNWLSRGMLGAGGTDDSSQFSGVVSDEVIKDIYEATKFHPLVLSNGDVIANDKICVCAINFSIHQISATLWSMKYGQEIAKLILLGLTIECKLCEESATITSLVESGKVIYPCSEKVILLMKTPFVEEDVLDNKHPSCSIQVDVSPNSGVELLVKGTIQPLEVTLDAEFLTSFVEFFDVLKSLSFQHERVLSSLNGIENVNARLSSKAEYILSSHKKVMWDISIINFVINVPWRNAISEQYNLVLELGALLISKFDLGFPSPNVVEQPCNLKNFSKSISTSNFSMSFHLQDLYDHFDVKLNDFEMKIMVPHHTQTISIFEKSCASVTLASCMILDESILKQLEVYIVVSSLHAQLSPSIYGAVLELISHLSTLHTKSESVTLETLDPFHITSHGPRTPVFGFSVNMKLESLSFQVDLANNDENSFALMLALQDLDIRYALTKFEECCICTKALKITIYPLRGEGESHVLCSSGNPSSTNAALPHDIEISLNDGSDNFNDKGCFLLHYESHRTDLVCNKCTVCLNDADLHCYPYVIALLTGFFDRLSVYGTSSDSENSYTPMVDTEVPNTVPGFGFQRFGFSNFFETGSSAYACIPLDHFPFVTIRNSGSLATLESSLLYANSEWRKYLNLRDRKIRNPKSSIKEGYKFFHAPPLASTSDIEAFQVCPSSSFFIDLQLCRSRVHFHDSSCIIGTITLPISKSSLFVNEDSIDVLCSTEGLILTSSWCAQNFRDFLWGPSLPNLSPILNLRVRKEKSTSLSSQFEISISIQHVYCILPAEYLAIIIGYFSLSDWSSHSNDQPVTKNRAYIDARNDSSIIYKFEILDSTLILPIKSNEHQFLKVDIQQLYCSFIHESSSDYVLKEIPLECLVPEHKLAKRNHCLNVFGQDLFLSFLLFKDDGYGSLMFDQDTDCANITLIAPISADVWVRIPCESESLCNSSPSTTCVMTRIRNCQIFADDGHFLDGFEALQDVIDQFSSLYDQSKGFKSDVLQFLKLKRCLKESSAVLPVGSSMMFTEVRCYVNLLLIKLNCFRKDSMELVAKAEMQFLCSASLRNDTILSLGLSFSSLELYSLPNSIKLAQCTSTCSSSSVLDISLSESIHQETELFVSLPSLDIWLHLSDWTKVVDLISSYAGQLTKTAILDPSSKNLTLDAFDLLKNVGVDVSPNSLHSASMATLFASVNMKQDAVVLIVRSENIGITFHFPVWVSKEACRQLQLADDCKETPHNISSDVLEGNDCKFIAVKLHSKSTEFFLEGRNIKFKSNMEKLSGTVLICDKSVQSWPLFQIYQVNVEAEISDNQMELVHVELEIQCDRSDVWLSHCAFYFWHGVQFNIHEAETSQFPFGGINIKAQLRKVSLLLSDGRWSCSGPLLEILLRNILLHANVTQNNIEGSVSAEFQVNYNNIHKVLWEPFIEPWQFQMTVIRKNEMSALLNSSIMTDIQLTSTGQLNLNFTESLIECLSRTMEMIKDAWDLMEPYDLPESQKFLNSPFTKYMFDGRYAPYILQNLTSVPLIYHVYRGLVNSDEFDVSEVKDGNHVQPGCSVPIYINETPEEQLFRYRPAHSSDRLNEQKSNGVSHHFITIQLEGTSVPSARISMDLVGLTYFEVDFSKAYNESSEENGAYTGNGFVVPVVVDVSVQRYCKFIRLYSTVVLSNATSMALELRFDIPFGVSPKILDPIYPGQELPLPLHLAEAGRMSWRPIGNSYLWSEYHNLSSLLSQESKIGFLKSFVCYPTLASGDPFRCCVSVRNVSLNSSSQPKKGSSNIKGALKKSVEKCGQILHNLDESRKRLVHQVTLSTPLIVNNYLPEAVSLTIESGGVTHTASLSEVETSFHHIDPSHDLGLEIHMRGFKPSDLKFPRTEKFCTIAKFSGNKFSLSETIAFYPELSNGPVYVTVEKTMDAFSGARELFIFVPFLLYNCSGFPFLISESADEMKGLACTIPSCYDLVEQELLLCKKDGLSLLSSSNDSCSTGPPSLRSSFPKNHIVSTRENVNLQSGRFLSKPLISSNSLTNFHEQLDKIDVDGRKAFVNSSKNKLSSGNLLTSRDSNSLGNENGRVSACMYSPNPISSTNEVMVTVSRCLPECVTVDMPISSWSSPFFLVPPSGSTTILVPKSSSNAAFMLSVTSSAVAGPFAGRTNAITFQPRYVISNACSKDLCFKQKGTDFVSHLGIGEHAHLHWTDTTRELLVSICYSEPGWQWSGSFLPDHLGDTQVKMRNYVSNALNMIRVEVQNADVSIGDEKIVGNLHGNSGTNLILLSDDDTGYMPYRIDNFSKERLRIYQQRCETFETIVYSYTSCHYAWDEPCYPHRLTVEVPGERVVGSYALDDVKEYMPVYLSSTSEKPERTLLLSIHAEGATKVLCIIDSSYHILDDMKNSIVPPYREKKKHDQKQDKFVDYEKFSIVIPHIGISLINSYPQELLFACAKSVTIDLLQSLDRQKLSFQILSLQIDNQLRTTPYPVILSFDREYRCTSAGQITTKDNRAKARSERILPMVSENSYEPVFCLAVSKWRKKDISLVSFEYISLRVADFRLELEQEVILSLFDFFKNVSSTFQCRVLPFSDPLLHPHMYDMGLLKESSTHVQTCKYLNGREDQLLSMGIHVFNENNGGGLSLPSIVPIGAPWQQIYLLARRQQKIYVEVFDLAPIKLTFSFSSTPWMLRNKVLTSGESLIHRGLMALADVEGARIHLKQLTISHHMASWESIQEILIRHYTRQLLHEMYKVFGSAGVIGNPMGFARSVGLGIRDFLSMPARSILQSPTGLITGMAQGSTSLFSNTVYAISDAATQFSKAAHKGIVAFTFDDQAVSRMEKQQIGAASHSKGVINEVLEGLTALLQSPIKGAETHGLPGVLSGIALGITGLVAKPAASILEITGKTAQSIRNRSKLYQMGPQRFRARLSRSLSRELPLRPYSWEEAVGASVLVEAENVLKLKDEVLVVCKALKQAGKFVIITERFVLVVSCPTLVDLGKHDFQGIAADPEWMIESEIGLETVIHADTDQGVVHIVGSSPDTLLRQNQHHPRKAGGTRIVRWNNPPTTLPLFQTNLELSSKEDADSLLQILLSTIELGKEQGWGYGHLLHQGNIK